MMSIKELLADQASLVRRVQAKPPAPSEIRRLAAASGGIGKIPLELEETGKLQQRIEAQVKLRGAQKLTKRDLRTVCGVFLHPPAPPGRDADVGDAIVDEVNRRKLRSAMLALFNSYLDGFRFDDADVTRVGRRLEELTRDVAGRNPQGWAARARSFALFDAAEAPMRIATHMLSSQDLPAAVLAEAGLGTEVRARGQLVEAAFRLACIAAGRKRGEDAVAYQRRILEWAHDRSGKLIFPGSFSSLATALLEPWDKSEPDQTYRVELIRTLERGGGGDPRTNPARWRETQQVAPIAYGILIRWLTRASVMQFLDIVGRSMAGPAARQMWAYRRAFWTSYLLGGDGGPTIQKAWIAFGSQAAALARAAARETGDNSFLAFGKQNEKSAQHSALIVEINDLVIVDWSHSAQYNVWKRSDERKPKLFELNYPSGTLYHAPRMDSHINPAGYTWQKRLAQIIEGRYFHTEKQSWRPRRV